MNTAPQGADFLKEWSRGDEIGFIIDDVTKQDRTAFNINEMFTQLQEVIKKYGFDFKMWGLKTNFEQSINKSMSKERDALLTTLLQYNVEGIVRDGVKITIARENISVATQKILIEQEAISEDPKSNELNVNRE